MILVVWGRSIPCNIRSEIVCLNLPLFSGVFYRPDGIALTPVIHRLLHKFHIDDNDMKSKKV